MTESEKELSSAVFEIVFFAHKYSAAYLKGENFEEARNLLL